MRKPTRPKPSFEVIVYDIYDYGEKTDVGGYSTFELANRRTNRFTDS